MVGASAAIRWGPAGLRVGKMELADEPTARHFQRSKRLASVFATTRYVTLALLAALTTATGTLIAVPQRSWAVEPYFCIELVLSRNWPAAQFYCDAASTPGNMGIVLAEGIAHFFGAQNTSDVAHAARLWRDVPPIANESEWRNISSVFDPEIDIIAREAANLDRVAQYKLGVLHETGHFETPDKAAALFRYEQAARANLPEAHIALARIYLEGIESIGLEADPVKSEEHLMSAIELRTPSQRRTPDEAPQEAPVDAIADAGTGDDTGVTVEPAGISESEKTAAAVEILGTPDETTPEIELEVETDIASVDVDTPSADSVAVAPGVDAAPSASTPTGTLPSERGGSSDIDLAPEVLAALLAAADNLDDAQIETSSSGQSSASAQSPDITLTTEPVATASLSEVEPQVDVEPQVEDEPEVEDDPTDVEAPNVRFITIVPIEQTPSRPVPGSGSDVTVAVSDVPVVDYAAESQGVAEPVVATSIVVEPVDNITAQDDGNGEDDVELDLNSDGVSSVEPVAEAVESVPTIPILPSGTGGVRGGPETRQTVLSGGQAASVSDDTPAVVAVPVAEPEPDLESSTVTANLDVLSTETSGETVVPAGEDRWSPPADVAELYYPREPLDEEPSAPEDVAVASASAGASTTVSAGSSRLETTEPFDRSAVSCANNATGATLAMPVVPDVEDAADDGSPLAADQMTDTAALAKIEEGIRAKSAGNIEGALAAWRPLAVDGNPTAQYLVGLLFVTGEAVPRNLREAYAWLSLAATRGHQLATCELIRLEQRMSEEDVALARQQAIDLAADP